MVGVCGGVGWKGGIVVDALWRTLLAVLPQNYAEGLLNTDCVPSRCVSDTGKHCVYFLPGPMQIGASVSPDG